MARWTSAAATAESTPPERPQIARPSPIWARTASTVSSMIDAVVQLPGMPAISCRNRSSTCWPCGEWPTSGWYCTPASRRSGSSNAATAARSDAAVTANPSGARTTESPWLIQTGCRAGRPSWSTPPSTVSSVRPYSRVPSCATSPPSASAMAWKP